LDRVLRVDKWFEFNRNGILFSPNVFVNKRFERAFGRKNKSDVMFDMIPTKAHVPGVLTPAFSLLCAPNVGAGIGGRGVDGSIFFTGACLLPGAAAAPNFIDFSGELYIPNTSASASFVLIVTVGSGPMERLERNERLVFVPASLKSTGTTKFDPGLGSDSPAVPSGSGGHFLPRRPIARARTSNTLYSPPSFGKSAAISV
jgi:hypothetical protein